MNPPDHHAYVAAMAQQLGIELPPEELARVAGMYAHLARAAVQLRDLDIDEDTLPAGVFRAENGEAP